MVYCGKPSKGCKNCRERKIRCDQAVPACSQCIRAQKLCPGYRNMLDLAFRNESSSVIEKAKARSSKSTPPRTSEQFSPAKRCRKDAKLASASASDRSVLPSASLPGSGNLLPLCQAPCETLDWTNNYYNVAGLLFPASTFSMQPTIEEFGINYFVSNFFTGLIGPPHGHFGYLDDLCREEGLNDALRVSMIAAGLGVYSNTAKSLEILGYARKQYTVALQHINTALRSPKDSVKNSTLVSIIIVAIFEASTGPRKLSLKGWTEHINGAATLVKLRGRAQLKSKVGLGVFIQATSHLLLSCMQRVAPMPQQIVELRREAFRYVPQDPGWRFLQCSDECSIFRGAVHSGELSDPETIINIGMKLDNDMAKIFSDVPPEWLYETVFTDVESDFVYDKRYDIYYDFWIARIWNGMRCTRILLNEIIRMTLFRGFTSVPPCFTEPEYRTRFQAATNTVIKMRDGILQSVPQHCGFVKRKPFQSRSSPSYSTPEQDSTNFGMLSEFDDMLSFTELLDSNELSLPASPDVQEPLVKNQEAPAAGGYFLLWPLYTAAVVRVSQVWHRKYVIKVLDYIGQNMGIMQGSNLSNFIQSSHPMNESDFRLEADAIAQFGAYKGTPIVPLINLIAKGQ